MQITGLITSPSIHPKAGGAIFEYGVISISVNCAYSIKGYPETQLRIRGRCSARGRGTGGARDSGIRGDWN